MGIIPPLLYFGIEDGWVAIDFRGEITQVQVLEHNHSYLEYTIATDKGIIKTIDPHNVLYGYKAGIKWKKEKARKLCGN